MIFFTGVGSLLSDRFPIEQHRWVLAIPVAIGGVVFALTFLIQPFMDATIGYGLATRALLVVCCTAPLSAMLGFCFPIGMNLVSRIAPDATPWMWGVNGAAGVMASIVAVAISMWLGIHVNLLSTSRSSFPLAPSRGGPGSRRRRRRKRSVAAGRVHALFATIGLRLNTLQSPQMSAAPESIESLLAAAAAAPGRPELVEALDKRRPEALTAIVEQLRADGAIDRVERFERILKDLLKLEMATPLDGDRIREIARLQRHLGFLLKYKSYAIKAASPLGYSVFIQTPREGFSFQRHLTHKTEIFYILDVMPGGYVFLCDFADWERIYRRDSFAAWLGGETNPRYERFRYAPQPGDVIVIDKLNVVHTVIGCVLAEFATVSTDMVDRLFDQNEGRPIPPHFSRQFAEARLRNLRWPALSNRVEIGADGVSRTAVPWVQVGAEARVTFGEGVVVARSHRCEPRGTTEIETDPARATCLHIGEGSGRLVLGDEHETRRTSPPTLNAEAGDLFLITPGAHYALVNDGPAPLVVSEHRIPPDIAFCPSW
jgi:hypothetical protein